MIALADSLGWKYSIKRLIYRSSELFTSVFLGPSLSGIHKKHSSSLQTPWPDLIITAGRRNEPVARWIKQQTNNRAKIAHLGRPWAPLDNYDLIITTPQYTLPERNNILHLSLPLHSVTKDKLAQWRDEWPQKLPALPRPWWIVLLGGNSGPYVFLESKGKQLGEWVNQQAKKTQGSVLVSDSARTPIETYSAFLDQLTVPNYDYHWQPDSNENPYQGYLALADHLIVTGESMSMLTEAAATETPLYLFDLADCPQYMPIDRKPCRPWWSLLHNYRYKPLTHRLSTQFAPERFHRDISRIQTRLVDSGRAVWVGEEFSGGQLRPENNLQLAANRIREMFF